MSEVASRDLRNGTRALLDRVGAGESITITVDGRPVAVLGPVGRRPRFIGRHEFVQHVLVHQADAGLGIDVASLTDETTDDLQLP